MVKLVKPQMKNSTKERQNQASINNPEQSGIFQKAIGPVQALQVQISNVYKNELADESTYELVEQIHNELEQCLFHSGTEVPELAGRLDGAPGWILLKSRQAADCTLLRTFKHLEFNLLFHRALDQQTKIELLHRLKNRLLIAR